MAHYGRDSHPSIVNGRPAFRFRAPIRIHGPSVVPHRMVNVNKIFPRLSIRVKLALAYDLEMAETQTARELQAAEQHVDLVTKIVQGPLLKERFTKGSALPETERVVTSLLRTEPSLYQVKV